MHPLPWRELEKQGEEGYSTHREVGGADEGAGAGLGQAVALQDGAAHGYPQEVLHLRNCSLSGPACLCWADLVFRARGLWPKCGCLGW